MFCDSISARNDRLVELGKMVVDGNITYKLDFLGTVQVQGAHYFNVFRRYNSPYNIVIEDRMGDVYLQKDYTVRRSLRDIFCLEDARSIYTMNALSFRHNGPVPCTSVDLADMYWSEIQSRYQAVSMNLGGVFLDWSSYYSNPYEYVPEPAYEPAYEPFSDHDAANVLLSLNIPPLTDPFEVRECDGGNLSMKFADIQSRKRKREEVSCYCNMDEESEVDDSNYTVLRSGTMIPKTR